MEPNTNGWSEQDNAYGNDFCGDTLNYQNVPNIGTSANNYANKWGVAFVSYPFCLYSTVTESFYNILSGTNLNSGTVFETWYTLSSSGYPTTAWLVVYPPGGNYYTYSASIPNGNPNIAINGWENVVVCDFNGCNTTFNGGAGTIYYYQLNMKVSNPITGTTTSETSNCNYGSVTINSYDNSGTQPFTCP